MKRRNREGPGTAGNTTYFTKCVQIFSKQSFDLVKGSNCKTWSAFIFDEVGCRILNASALGGKLSKGLDGNS